MPKPPGDIDYFDKVNMVINAWARPCDAPWYIYIETLKPAALKAFLTLITFGWDDVARGYFRPRGLGTRRTGKRRGKWRSKIPTFPEPGEEWGKRLPGAEEMKGEQWSRAGKTLWRLDSLAQMGLFWWLVADVTVDFFFDWTSLLYETVWCQAASEGRFSYSTDLWQTKPGLGWWRLSFEIEDYEYDPPAWLFVSGTSGPSGCLAAAGISFEKHPSFPAPTSTAVRLVERHTNVVYAQTGPEDTEPDGSAKVPVSGNIPPGVRFEVEVWHDAEFANAGKGFVTAMENVE